MLSQLSPGRRKQSSSAAHSATAAGGQQEQAPPQSPQRAGSRQSIEFSAGEIKDALRASVDEITNSNSNSPRRLPAPFTSLMSPRKNSNSGTTGTTTGSPTGGRESSSGSSGGSSGSPKPSSGHSNSKAHTHVTFQLSGTSSSPTPLLGRAASASSVSPTPAPTPSDAAAAARTTTTTTNIPVANSPGASSLWGLLGRKLPSDGPMHKAAQTGDLPLIQALMAQDRHAADAPGDGSATPLMLAAGAGHAEVVSFLVAHAKADVMARDLRKRTALHHLALGPGGADRAAAGAVAGCLCKGGRAGAGIVDARDEEGLTALHHAAILARVDMIRVLLKHGADARLVVVGGADGEGEAEVPMDARRLCEEQCHGVPLAQKREALRLLGEGAAQAEAEAGAGAGAVAKRAAEDGAGSLASPVGCVHACLSRLCGESGLGAEDEDEVEVEQPMEHQLAPVFRRSGIPAEATELYMANLRSQGFDNVLALRHLAQDRFRMSLNKYIPDRQDRKRVVKALEEELGLPLNSTELPPLPPTHLPAFEWLIQLLSIPQDTALRYADALRGGLAVHTGEELLGKRYEEVEPVLVDVGILQGHRKAVKVLLKQQQRK